MRFLEEFLEGSLQELLLGRVLGGAFQGFQQGQRLLEGY